MCIYRKGQCQCLSIFYPFYYLYYLAAARGPGLPCEVARDTLLWALGESQTFLNENIYSVFIFQKYLLTLSSWSQPVPVTLGQCGQSLSASILIWFSFLMKIFSIESEITDYCRKVIYWRIVVWLCSKLFLYNKFKFYD